MPELPEIEAYIAALRARVVGEPLVGIRVSSFSLLRTYVPPVETVLGKRVESLSRLGKRIVFNLTDGFHLVIHLMVAGRLHWHLPGKAIPKKYGLAAFDFPQGTMLMTEAGTKRRASLHVIVGEAALEALDPGGIEVADATLEEFRVALLAERHTLKRALSDARFISGIGGAFADEILHAAQLSPLQMNTNLDDAEIARLFEAVRDVMARWTEIRITETGDGFPEKVTAFHPDMSVHGKYGEPCPVCRTTVQRIVYSSRETNYCPTCQTGGKLLADRSLSRLLKNDWPATIDEL
jgi:formamidopyrimidine-DNA glycosylase